MAQAKINEDTGCTAAEERFAHEYIIDFNAGAAYVRSGHKDTVSKSVLGHRMLKKVKVANFIKTLIEERNERTKVTAAHVIYMLLREANDKNNSDIVRHKTQELLGRHVGMWEESTAGFNVIFNRTRELEELETKLDTPPEDKE